MSDYVISCRVEQPQYNIIIITQLKHIAGGLDLFKIANGQKCDAPYLGSDEEMKFNYFHCCKKDV
jgi:hypothetical protein